MDSQLVVDTYTLLKGLGQMILVALVVGWFWFRWSHRRLISLAKTLPIVDPVVPLLGNLLDVIKDPGSASTKFLLSKLVKAADKGEEAFCIWAGPCPLVFISKPEDIQLVFTRSSSLHKGYFYSMVEFAIGSGLLIGPVSQWRLIRRHFLPVFHGSNLEHVVPSSNDRGRQIVQLLREGCVQGPVDILPLMRVPTFLNVCNDAQPPVYTPPQQTRVLSKYLMKFVKVYVLEFAEYADITNLLFGDETPRIIPKDPKVHGRAVDVIMRTLQLWSERFVQPWLYSDRIFTFLYKKDVQDIEDLSEYITKSAVQVLIERMSKIQYEEIAGHLGYSGQCTIFDAFISLRQADPSFNLREFQNEVVTILSAGTNSAAVSLSSYMLALAWHPDIQEKLHEEVVSVLGDDLMRDVTTEDIRNMPYLDQALKESWRRYTVFPFNQRKTTEDLKLSFGVMPAGSSIQVSMIGVHMNPNIYPDPYKFDPERFSAENMPNSHKFALLPFSGGPRNCIAMAYATLFIKIAIVHVVREFTLHTTADKNRATFKFLIEAQRENGYPVWVEKRSY